MAAATDTTTGTITLTAGSASFTTSGVNMQTRGHLAGDIVIRNGFYLVIATITGENSGTLAELCPTAAAGSSVAVRIRFQPDGSRVAAAARDLIELLGNGSIANLISVPTDSLVTPVLADRMGFFDASNSNTMSPATVATLLQAGSQYAAKSANYTVVAPTDHGALLAVSASGAARTIALPSAATAGNGFEVTVEKSDSSANTVTIDANASETIGGALTLVLATQYATVRLRCDGTNWQVMSWQDITTFGRSLLDDATAGAALTTLGVSAFAQTILDDAAATNVLTTLGVSTFVKTILDDADAATARATLGLTIGTAIREVLTATRTYYVRTDGSDSNTGLANTAGGAFLTIQKAINVVAALDRSTYQVTITIGAGTFAETITFYPGVGTLAPLLNGAGATSTFLKGIACAGTQAGSSWRISNVGFYDTAAGWGIKCSGPGFLDIASVDFGGTTRYQHVRVESGFVLSASGNFSISGGASQQAFDAIHADIDFHSRTITVTANITLSTFMSARGGAYVQVWSCTFSVGAFTVTGTRYVANENGVLSTGGGGASFIPGTIAGSTATGGQYT